MRGPGRGVSAATGSAGGGSIFLLRKTEPGPESLERELGQGYVDADHGRQLACEPEALLAQRTHVLEDTEPEVVLGQLRGRGAMHDRAGTSGDRVRVPNHLTQRHEGQPRAPGQTLRL